MSGNKDKSISSEKSENQQSNKEMENDFDYY